MSHEANNQQTDNEQIARRRLLKAAVYTPPVILGSMIAMPDTAQAVVATLPSGDTFTVSAATSYCNPCTKLINGTSVDPAGDALNCLKNQCTDACINCTTFVANAASYGKTTCEKCEKVTKKGCPAPAACSTATNKKGGACCDNTLTTCKY